MAEAGGKDAATAREAGTTHGVPLRGNVSGKTDPGRFEIPPSPHPTPNNVHHLPIFVRFMVERQWYITFAPRLHWITVIGGKKESSAPTANCSKVGLLPRSVHALIAWHESDQMYSKDDSLSLTHEVLLLIKPAVFII